MKPEFRSAIEEHYDIAMASCQPGPRQFVAETYIIHDSRGNRYFCKLTDKPVFIPEIIRSLPALAGLRAGGIANLSAPIPGKTGFHLFVENTLVVLFGVIPAAQSYDYGLRAFGELTGRIHSVKACSEWGAPEETFEFSLRGIFEERFEEGLKAGGGDPVAGALRKVLRTHEADIRFYLSEFERISALCKGQDPELVITHGDAPGNVLVKAFDDLHLIDWDELILAPPERDLWIIDQFPDFMAGYGSVRPDYQVDQTMRSYCIYKYYFRSIVHSLSEIFREADEAYRLGHVRQFEEGCLTGWMAPKLREINPGRK